MSSATMRSACAATIRFFRTRKGLSQETLALEANIPRSYVFGLEHARHTPSLETIEKMLPVFGIGWVEFFQQFERALPRSRMRRTIMEETIEDLRKFMDQSGEPKWLADPNQKILHVNPALLTFMGVEFDRVVDMNRIETIHPEDRKALLAGNKEAYANRKAFVTRYRIRVAGGRYREVVQSTLPQFTPKGKFIGMLGTMIPEPE